MSFIAACFKRLDETPDNRGANPVDWKQENSNLSEEIDAAEVPISGPTDGILAAAVCQGDESAFEMLFERHRRRVAIIAGRFFQRKEEIEDVTQECFTKAYFGLKEFSDNREGSFAAWLSKIAFNICYDELRRRRRRPEIRTLKLTEEELRTIGALGSESEKTSIESAAISRDLANKLLSGLSAEDRVVLVLLEVEGFSVSEIGAVMSWSLAKVKIRVFRARKALRQLLEKYL